MKIWVLALVLALALGLYGCAASVSPMPGMSIGFDLAPDNFGTKVEINPLTTGCEVSKSISWNWAENVFCQEGYVEPDIETSWTPEINGEKFFITMPTESDPSITLGSLKDGEIITFAEGDPSIALGSSKDGEIITVSKGRWPWSASEL